MFLGFDLVASRSEHVESTRVPSDAERRAHRQTTYTNAQAGERCAPPVPSRHSFFACVQHYLVLCTYHACTGSSSISTYWPRAKAHAQSAPEQIKMTVSSRRAYLPKRLRAPRNTQSRRLKIHQLDGVYRADRKTGSTLVPASPKIRAKINQVLSSTPEEHTTRGVINR